MKLNKYFLLLFLYVALISCNNLDPINYRDKSINNLLYDIPYESGNWEHPNYKKAFNFYGNHRVIVILDKPSDEIHQVKIPWRRRDSMPHLKDIILVNSVTGKEIDDKYLLDINNDYGHIIFKPEISSTKYFFYYLPHKSTGGYYPKVDYLTPKKYNNKKWKKEINDLLENIDSIQLAKVEKFESIDNFHSFFPMEIISTKDELNKYFQITRKNFYLFPEYRDHPIKMTDYLPIRWTSNIKEVNGLKDDVLKGEYYSFQVGFVSPNNEIDDIDIFYTDLISTTNDKISKDNFTCFNKEGVDLNGKTFTKDISVYKNEVKALWFGLDIPKNTKEGIYKSYLIIKPSGYKSDTIYLKINVGSKILDDKGDSNPVMMSRLRWLNSTIGSENILIDPFEEVIIDEKTINILGREVDVGLFGIPSKISSYFSQEMTFLNNKPNQIISRPMSFNVKGGNDKYEKFINSKFEIFQNSVVNAEWVSMNSSENFNMNVFGLMEYDGMLDIKIQLISKNNIKINDAYFEVPMEKEASKYILGLGRKGGELKNNINWSWDITKHQEGLWLGNINKGLQFVLRDNNYERPLNTNFYQDKPLNLPDSWFNNSNGGISINIGKEEVLINNFSGERYIEKGDTINFNIRFLITPFKLINIKEHFNTRFVHKYTPVDSVLGYNGTIVNVHHANKINPYINYPFYNLIDQKKYIDDAHKKGIKVKLYNTIRELTYKAYELFPLKSLGDEIFNYGKGGGHSWLQEHLKKNYHSAWHAVNVNDASILNKGTSRWTNYYIEGINWLAKNNNIDGLYLDDIAFSRTTVKRIASVLSRNRESFVIDLHSANQFNNRDGFINSALLYIEHFPYVSRLWFGEYFEYNLDPDYWITEVSGIPFGLTGEMLENGGRPYHGLIYGMTTRVYHNYNPGNIWKLFDDFKIAESRMIGYWVNNSPVKIDNSKLKCTIYQRENEILIVLASWSKNDEYILLDIDWDRLGFNSSQVKLISPEILDLQKQKKYKIDDLIKVNSESGIVLKLIKN